MAEPAHLTERQKKWFASLQASLEKETGRSLAEWVAIARTCPETKPGARVRWLKSEHGIGINRAAHILSEAFPSDVRWDEPEKLIDNLWTDPASRAIYEAVNNLALALPDTVHGPRKSFAAWSRKVQFAAMKPVKGGTAVIGFAVEPGADLRLSPRGKNESWSDRLKGQMPLASVAEVDDSVAALLKAAWERS